MDKPGTIKVKINTRNSINRNLAKALRALKNLDPYADGLTLTGVIKNRHKWTLIYGVDTEEN